MIVLYTIYKNKRLATDVKISAKQIPGKQFELGHIKNSLN